jgi:hypothetical protein
MILGVYYFLCSLSGSFVGVLLSNIAFKIINERKSCKFCLNINSYKCKVCKKNDRQLFIFDPVKYKNI